MVNYDLNLGAGGWDVYIAYKTSSTANPWNGYITDICVNDKDMKSLWFEGRYFEIAPRNSGYNGELNKGTGSGTANIYLYFTRDRYKLGSYGGDKRVITKLSVTTSPEDDDLSTAAISWRNSDTYDGLANMNERAGGNKLYVQQHFTTQTLRWKKKPTFFTDLTFNGMKQILTKTDPGNDNDGVLKYRVDGGQWSPGWPGVTEVGIHKVEARLEGIRTYNNTQVVFANNSDPVTATVTIHPPIVKASNLKGVFNQGDRKVHLTWDDPSIPGNYADFKWVVCRDGEKIAELASDVHSYSDAGFTNEAKPVYDVYYVSNFWDINTRRDDTKASVTVSTTRSVPVNNLMVEQQSDRIVFKWISDAYPEGFGHKFCIYVDGDGLPLYTLEPKDMQTSFQWEHRTTDQHNNPQSKVDPETGVHYTEQPLNACAPHTYRIEGVIDKVVLNAIDISPKAIGEATKFYSFDASKGVYEGSVKLTWHVDQQGSTLTKTYIVERRRAEQQDEAWETLTRMASTDNFLFYTDETALPGIFYDYRVTVEDKCDDGTIINNETTNIGFAKSTGTVSGRIAYGSTGTAVQGVDVVMTMTSSEGEQSEQFHSMYFTDFNGAVTWDYPSEDYAAERFTSSDFSLQMWLYPEAFSESTIVDFGNGTGLGLTATGGLTFNGQTFDGIALQQNVYNHIVLTRSGTTLTCYVLTTGANSTEPNVQKATLTMADGTLTMADAKVFSLGRFKGAADEFRLWTKCLTEANILENYDHLLVGDEQQLETYWTFDEGLRTQFFDYSRDGTNYRKHHGAVGSNAQASTLTPGVLRLKAKTDVDGNYIIQGIPFTGEGTTYSIVPLYGVHEFNPGKALRFVGRNALVHTADFEDVSSFSMSGYVYYAGTNVPVEGVMMYVDGIVQSKEGKTVQTNSNGQYTLSVPIGNHYVEARLGNHTMVDGGRWPTQGTHYFDRPVQHDFADSTLVNFVGRVGGGERNDTLAVGFAESKNNIGVAEIRLGLLNESFSFNMKDDHISDALTERTWQSDTTSIRSTASTGTGYDAKYIRILTDPLTGEFSALLPPLKYITNSINVENNHDVEFFSMPEIDLTQVGQVLTDSLKQVVDGDSVWCYYKYNTKMIQTYFAPPQLEVVQRDNEPGAYGIKTLKDYVIDYGTSQDTLTIDNIWRKEADGSTTYLLGYPLYEMGDWYSFDLFAHETYNNYDSGEAVSDIIPLNGQTINILNELKNDQPVVYRVDDPTSDYKVGDIYDPKPDTYQLGNDGKGTYQWQIGYPNITPPYTRTFSITMERNDRTYVMMEMPAIVLGHLSTGNNFVTKGPDVVDFVLRDPPGSKSKTTLKSASYTLYNKVTFDKAYGDEKFVADILAGSDLQEGVGVGVVIMSSSKAATDTGLGVHTTWEKGDKDETKTNVTITESISTGAAYPYVGSDGDVYVGTSYNLLLGEVRNLEITRKDQNSPYTLQVKDALSLGTEIATGFKYSQYEIRTVMIPKWEDQRNSFFTEVADSITAYQYVNTGNKSVYLTWLKPGDEGYGKFGYRYVPADFVDEEDSVNWCNIQIENWEGVIRYNEEEKVKAIEEGKYENFSIDGANTYTYSTHNERSEGSGTVWSWKIGGVFNFTSGFLLKGAGVRCGINGTLSTEHGRIKTSDEITTVGDYQDWEYTIFDGNRDIDLSINKYPAATDSSGRHSNSDIFTIFGGQTYNPYEPVEYTYYYKPGTPLGNGTVQMEQPHLRIGVGDQAPSQSVTLTDIPSGHEATVTLYCTNMANVHQGVNFSYNLIIVEKTNDQGLEILMDGVPVNGRSILLNQSETTKKVITIRQTDQSVLDYEGIKLRFCSQYQPMKIYDEVTLNAHFVPSSSPIDLVISEPVLNIETLDRNHGDLILRVTGFDRQFKGMTKVGVEYRYEGSTVWSRPDTLTFLVNRADSTDLHDQVLPATGDLRLRFNMKDDNFYPQGTYTFRAYTNTKYDTDDIVVYSNDVTVVKDNVAPTALTTPTPTNGILGYGDDMSVEFNEDIVPGYVTDKNVIITARLNRQEVDHDVAKQLGGSSEQHTVNPVFLNGDFTVSFWMKWTEGGSILKHGRDRFALTIDDSGHFGVSIGQSQFVSSAVLPRDEWVFLALNFKDSEMRLSALAQQGTQTLQLFDMQEVDSVSMSTIVYSDDNDFYLGNMKGALHDLCLYGIWRDLYDVAATKYQSKDGYVYGLMNYWPMDEGHGNVAADARHTHDFTVDGQWEINNTNYAFGLENVDGATGVSASIGHINTYRDESYAIELWHKGAGVSGESGDECILETGGSEMNRLRLHYDAQKNIVLDYGTKFQTVAASEVAKYGDWNHLALNVVRGQSAIFYCDGKRTAVISERDVPPFSGSTLTLGRNSSGIVDEVRVWKATIQEGRLLQNMYCTLDTADVYSRGLVAYYPFEKDAVVNGVPTKVFTLDDMAPGQSSHSAQYAPLPSQQTEPAASIAPPLQNAIPETRLMATPVASERKVVVRLKEATGVSPRDLEGCLLNITVDKVNDMHGNQSSPIRWTAYVQQNTLKWSKDSVTVVKGFGEEYYFDVDIVNKGSKTEYYTLYNMPVWLSLVDALDGSPVEPTGELAPQSKKTLRFLVNALVAVGNYSVSVGLQGNDEILEPLNIVMKVRGAAPAWTVDPDLYENAMSVVGQVYVNGVLMSNSESLVAAFIDGECRGVAPIQPIRGAAFVALSVYGTAQQMVNGTPTDLDKDKAVTFRVWDASRGVAYTNVNLTLPSTDAPVSSVAFDPSVTYGDFSSPVVFTRSNLMEQELSLRQDWNWISLGVEPVDTRTSVVFKDISSWNVYIKDRSTGIYFCNGTYWSGSLADMHANTMYKMNLTQLPTSKELPALLPVTGEPVKPSESKVTLKKGWNWIGYVPTVAMTPGMALAGANPKEGDQVKSQKGFSFYGPYGWDGNLDMMESGKGYLYYSVDSVTKQFSYPATTSANAPMRSPLKSKPAGSPSVFFPVEPESYPDNMSMVVRLVSDGEAVLDAELGAFVEDECRGTATETGGLYYLLIAGEGHGKPMQLRAAIGDMVCTVCTEVPFNSDAIIGTPWEPFVIDLNDLTGIASPTAHPAQDGTWYNLQGIPLGKDKPKAPGVYLYRGQKVVVDRKLNESTILNP